MANGDPRPQGCTHNLVNSSRILPKSCRRVVLSQVDLTRPDYGVEYGTLGFVTIHPSSFLFYIM
jgi:hypothetical protein